MTHLNLPIIFFSQPDVKFKNFYCYMRDALILNKSQNVIFLQIILTTRVSTYHQNNILQASVVMNGKSF